MHDSIISFRTNITKIKNLGGIYSTLNSRTTPALDLSDILRAELVMAMSVLDHFIHSSIEEGMIEIYENKRPTTDVYDAFEISISNIQTVLTNPLDVIWFKEEIRKKHGHLSFQRSEKIASKIKLISDKKLWEETAQILNKDPKDIILQIDLISDRRNQIVHQADIDPTYPNLRWPIDFSLVENSTKFIEDLCESIFEVIK